MPVFRVEDPEMTKHPLQFETRKAICVQLGESAGKQIADLLQQMATKIEALQRDKVDVTPIISPESAKQALDV